MTLATDSWAWGRFILSLAALLIQTAVDIIMIRFVMLIVITTFLLGHRSSCLQCLSESAVGFANQEMRPPCTAILACLVVEDLD